MSSGSGWFTSEETDWIVTYCLYTFKQLDRGETVMLHGVEVSGIDAFLEHVMKEFRQAFPYRYPENDVSALPVNTQRLQIPTLVMWNGRWLRETFRSQLQYLLNTHTGPVSESRRLPNVGAANLEGTTPSVSLPLKVPAPDPMPDAVVQDPQAADYVTAEPTSASFSKLPLDYSVSDETMNEWGDMLADLHDMAASSWAQCAPRELRRRRENLSTNVRHILNLLAYSTGCELYATGVMASHRDYRAFHSTSSRSNYFLQTDGSLHARAAFADFTSHYIGEALCVSRRCPAPVTIGDPEQDERPLPPPEKGSVGQRQTQLAAYFSYLLRWQGGGTEVPYHLLEEDAKNDRWQIVKKMVLPNGVQFVRNPMKMGETELTLWYKQLRMGWEGHLAENRVFQFDQPRPGIQCSGYQWRRAPNALIGYGPECLSYARLHLQPMTTQPAPRIDRIPNVHTDEPCYESVSRDDIATLGESMGEACPITFLLQALLEHDSMHPYQAADEDWITMIEGMPYLKLIPPAAKAFIDHLDVKNGWLPWAFFDAEHPTHHDQNLTRILAWCSPLRWRHGLTGTLIGGRCGVKWPVIILLMLVSNIRKVEQNPASVVRHYGVGRSPHVAFAQRDTQHINACMKSLHRALVQSTRQLASTLPYRLYGDKVAIEERLSKALHWRLEMGTTGITWFEPVVHDDPWHDYLTEINAPTPPSAEFLPTSGESSPLSDREGAETDTNAPGIHRPVTPNTRQDIESRPPNDTRRVRFNIDGVELFAGEPPNTGVVTRSRSALSEES